MFTNVPIEVWITLGLGLLILVFVGLVALNRLTIKKGTHPLIRQFLTQAIIQAYKLSDMIFDETDKRLHSVQKQKVATVVYDLLPDTISIFAFQFGWKKLLPKERFIVYVSEAYDSFVESFQTLKDKMLQDMLDEIGKQKQ
jgi:hypothetical protein